MAKKTTKGGKQKSNSLTKQFMLSAIAVLEKKIVNEQAKNDGRVPWGFASKLLKQG
jgi:hypothetical protein